MEEFRISAQLSKDQRTSSAPTALKISLLFIAKLISAQKNIILNVLSNQSVSFYASYLKGVYSANLAI